MEEQREAHDRARVFHQQHFRVASVAEQVRAFASAAWVAGPVGSRLYNSVFSPPDVRRIILAPAWFYTPNDVPDVERVRGAGVDLVVTDAVDVYSPRT